jgi:tetratricopeptide (TPR) repeat protein
MSGDQGGAPVSDHGAKPRQLPRDVTHFTGRERELGELDSLLDAQRRTVVISAIAGAAGVGKTSLAVHWAHRVRDRFPDGQLYVNLRGYDPGEPLTARDVLGVFLRALDVPGDRIADDVDAMAATYRSVLSGLRVLIVLDNAATADQVRPLVPNEPGCMVVVTSRSALAGLAARDGAHRIGLDLLGAAEAYELVSAVIGSGRAEREAEAALELTRHCGWLPLALRIAAERVAWRPHVTVGDVARELEAEHRRLDVLAADDDEAATVRAVFSWSYQALPEELARAFRLLSVHPGPVFGLAVASVLLEVPSATARQRLDSLVAAHLVAEVAADRFQFHDLLRIYAGERASLDEEPAAVEAATGRCYEWYLHTAHAALYAFHPEHPQVPIAARPRDCRPLEFGSGELARQWFAAEQQNLLAVIQRAPEADQHTVGWQLPNVVDCYLAMNRFRAEQILVHQLGLAAAVRAGDRVGEYWAHNHLGEAYQASRRYEEAVDSHLRSLSIAADLEDGFGQAAALNDLGNTYLALGRFAEAVEHLRQALVQCRAIQHPRNEGTAEVNLGAALLGLDQTGDAVEHALNGLTIFRRIGAGGSAGWALWTLGRIRAREGDVEDAIRCFREAVDTYGEAAHHYRGAEVLVELGVLFEKSGRHAESREAWRSAHRVFSELGSAMKEDVEALLAEGVQSS